MIETDNLVREMLSCIGYAQQTLRLHPEQRDKMQRYLQHERLRFAQALETHQEGFDILSRVVVY